MAYRKLDTGYSWIVMVCAFLANLITGGFLIAPALYLVEWYSVFSDQPKAVIAWIPSVAVLTRSLAAIPAGGLINQYGCRKVHVVGSLLTCISLLACSVMPNFESLTVGFALFGFFSGLMTLPPIVVIYEYFDKYKSLASGFSMCGHSLSSFINVALYRYSIDTFGWRGSMIIMAGVALNGVAFGMLFTPNKPTTKSKLCKSFDLSIAKNFNFTLFSIANCLHICQLNVLYQLSTSRAVSKGMSKMQGSMLPSCIGLASTGCRLIVSWISNMRCTSHIGLYAGCVSILSLFIAVSCAKPTDIIFLGVISSLSGLCVGGAATVTPATLVDLLGQEHLSNGWGLASALTGPMQTFILPAAGLVYDLTGDFNNSFYFGSALGALAGILSFIIVIRVHCFGSSLSEAIGDDQLQNEKQEVVMDEFGSQVICASTPTIAYKRTGRDEILDTITSKPI